MKPKVKVDWSSWSVVVIMVVIALIVCLVIETDILGNAIDQYFSIGKYRR